MILIYIYDTIQMFVKIIGGFWMENEIGTSRTNIIEHINNIYLEEELDKNSTCQNFRQVQKV